VLYWLFALAGYLLGSFPTGVVLSRRRYGIDVREMGSGNIGATNVTRVFGWYAGILVFVADFLKSFLPLYYIRNYFPDSPWLLTSTGAALVLGHCFSLYLKGRGGKGVATSFGCLAVVAPGMALFSASAYLVLLLTTRISAVGSLGGLVVTWIYLAILEPPGYLTALVAAISVVVIIRHRSNIRRLIETVKARSKKKE
jgi:glycerol-3-phosphate acyltransferase PlsY